MKSDEQIKIFGKEMSKVERYGWKIKNEIGKFKFIEKDRLLIDYRYQRDPPQPLKINEMAKEWDWVALQTITVCLREDGSYWVIDGQTRKLAADKRSDIDKLPCMVFELDDPKKEAASFLKIAISKTGVRMFSKFKNLLFQGDKTATGVKQLVEKFGYSVADHEKAGVVRCIGTLLKCYKVDPRITENVLSLSIKISEGKMIDKRLFDGLFYIEKIVSKRVPHQSLTSDGYSKRLIEIGRDEIIKSIHDARRFYEEGSPRVFAEGILQIMNKHTRNKLKLTDNGKTKIMES